MCGRFSLSLASGPLRRRLGVPLPPGLEPHYSPRSTIAPGEPVLVLRQEHGQPQAALVLWGLLPEWSKDALAAHRPFNARAETVPQKASFRGPWRHRRCLLPADGFFENRRLIRRRDGGPFWLAGLWDRWIGADGSEVESCCVITTAANGLIRPLHDRMPVLLPDGLEQAWLAPADGPGLRALEPLLGGWDPAGWEILPPLPAPAGKRAAEQLPLFG